MDIGVKIKTRRKELNMTADDLAQALNKDRSTIYRYEKGDIEKMPVSILPLMADVLKVSMGYLLGLDEKCTPDRNQVLDLILRLHNDESFFDLVSKISDLDSAQLIALKQMLTVFSK